LVVWDRAISSISVDYVQPISIFTVTEFVDFSVTNPLLDVEGMRLDIDRRQLEDLVI
jgi:hypothetical protein